MKAAHLALPFAILMSAQASAGVGSAEEMLSACKEVVTAKVSAEGIELPQTYEAGYCWGAFMTVQKVIRQSGGAKTPIFGVCAPEESTLSQLVAIFSDYASKNPQRLHEHYFNVSIDALKAAFPCAKSAAHG